MSRAWPRLSAKTVAQKPDGRVRPPLSPGQGRAAAALVAAADRPAALSARTSLRALHPTARMTPNASIPRETAATRLVRIVPLGWIWTESTSSRPPNCFSAVAQQQTQMTQIAQIAQVEKRERHKQLRCLICVHLLLRPPRNLPRCCAPRANVQAPCRLSRFPGARKRPQLSTHHATNPQRSRRPRRHRLSRLLGPIEGQLVVLGALYRLGGHRFRRLHRRASNLR